jgi:PAS domain S-box-containing protein
MPPVRPKKVRVKRAPRAADEGSSRIFGRTSSNLLSLAEDLAGVGYWRYNFTDRSLAWSDRVYQIYGLSRAVYGPPDSDLALRFFHPEDKPAADHAFAQAIANREGMEFELRLVRADGEVRMVIARAVCERDAAGEGIALLGVFQDVTERRRAEAAQQESHARLARIIELLPVGAVHVQAGVLSMNAEMEKVTGYGRDEIPSLELWFERLYGDASGKLLARYRDQRANGFPAAVIGQITRKDGEQRHIEFRACNDSIGEIWIVDDITERATVEREIMAARDRAEIGARSKSEFLANMSHELRTPLTAIIGFAGLLNTKGALASQERHWVSRIEDASKALHSIVNDVLDFSKLEDGAVELENEPFSLRALVEDTAALLAGQAEKKSVALEVEIEAGLRDQLAGDTGRLRQILLNLMSNAVKFTSKGRVSVAVTAEPAPPGFNRLRFGVADTGIGIPEAALGQLFERFVQADGSISRRFGGTGLGLAISRRLVELMGGEIGVDSRLGHGSTFWFRVDLAAATMAEALIEETAEIDGGELRVLVVEDAEPNQELIATILRSVGIDVDIACNGAEAIEAVRIHRYDLVLMDVQMPVMGGVQATEIIRRMGGELARLPIIALSANVLPEQVAEYRRAGMDAHLAKPINPREMLTAIGHWAAAGRTDDPDAEALYA